GIQHQNFEPLLDALTAHGEGELDALTAHGEGEKALTVLVNVSHDFGGKRRFHAALTCAERAERVGRRLLETGSLGQVVVSLAVTLMNKGVALDELGRYSEALGYYDEAIAIRKWLVDIVEVEGRTEVAHDLAVVLMNKGVTLSSL